jgi:hypothetical protein
MSYDMSAIKKIKQEVKEDMNEIGEEKEEGKI